VPGFAYIALLPFDILTDGTLRTAPHCVTVSNRRVFLYWPFWHEDRDGRIVPPVRAAAIPSRTSRPFYTVPPLETRIEIRAPPGRGFANALRIDIDGERDDDLATDIANTLLRQLRLRTNQWWIGHAHREGEDVIRGAYSIDSRGELVGNTCHANLRVEARLRIERPLTAGDFSGACAGIGSEQTIPPHWELLFDAIFFSIHRQDWRRALLDAFIACDLGVNHESLRAGRELGKPEAVVQHVLSDTDFLFNLRTGLAELFGSAADFCAAHPADYQQVRRLWSTRNEIAHGHVSGTVPGRGGLVPRIEAMNMMKSAMRLLVWLAALPRPALADLPNLDDPGAA
jgi:hypothetical protein